MANGILCKVVRCKYGVFLNFFLLFFNVFSIFFSIIDEMLDFIDELHVENSWCNVDFAFLSDKQSNTDQRACSE